MLLVFILLALFPLPQESPQKGEPITLHIKEVTRTQDENANEKGTSFHIKVTAETKTIVYSLSCEEFLNMEQHVFTGSCYHVRAGRDYDALLFDDAISFWRQGEKSSGTKILYDVVTEKEK
jgi:hypothetical protein